MMRKASLLLVILALLGALSGCTAASSEHRVGQAQGYGGPLTVNVTTREGKITQVEVVSHSETPNIGTRAIDTLPEAIVAAGTWDVETVSGATVTSNAIRNAVASAMGHTTAGGMATATDQSDTQDTSDLRSGFGMSAVGRTGPGQDAQGEQIYSWNVVFAHGMFDAQGRIVSMAVDQLEVLSPNGSDTSPRFSGWPGQGDVTEESFRQEVSSWLTKRGRGEQYAMTSGSWRAQMDAYQRHFEGKTVDELEQWFQTLFSDTTGKPLRADSEQEEEQNKYQALSEEQKAELTDLVSSATMSLEDSHGGIITAIRRAWDDAQQTRN